MGGAQGRGREMAGRLGPLAGCLGPPAAALGGRTGVPPLGRAGREREQAGRQPLLQILMKQIS